MIRNSSDLNTDYEAMNASDYSTHGKYNFSEFNLTLETPDLPSYMKITSTLFFAIIFLFGVFGNVLVILVVCWNRNMKTSVNIYLMNLCVADILVLTVCMPTVLVDVYARDVWYFGKTMCK